MINYPVKTSRGECVVSMPLEAARSVELTGADVEGDVNALLDGTHTRESLLAFCLDGAEDEHQADWHDYVDAVVEAAQHINEVAS